MSLTDPGRPATVRVHLMNGGITVKGANVKDVTVDASSEEADRDDDEEQEAKRKGLKRIPFASAGLTAEEQNNEVTIRAESMRGMTNLTVTVPKRTSVVLQSVNNGEIVVSDVEGEIDAEDMNGSIKLKDVAGSAVVHSMNGELHATFTRVDGSKPMAFSTMNGEIDVTFPPGLKANLSLRTDNGDVYSDFEVKPQPNPQGPVVEDARKKGGLFRVRIDKTVHATVNGGGPEIQFKSMNGSIYIRKGK